jgi:hypothetical protein
VEFSATKKPFRVHFAPSFWLGSLLDRLIAETDGSRCAGFRSFQDPDMRLTELSLAHSYWRPLGNLISAIATPLPELAAPAWSEPARTPKHLVLFRLFLAPKLSNVAYFLRPAILHDSSTMDLVHWVWGSAALGTPPMPPRRLPWAEGWGRSERSGVHLLDRSLPRDQHESRVD